MTTADQARASQNQRSEFLLMLYRLSNEVKRKSIPIWWVQLFLFTRNALRLDDWEVCNIVEYVICKGLVEVRPAKPWEGFESQHLSLTPDGLDHVENTLLHADRPPDEIAATNIVVVGEMMDSQLQLASRRATQVILHQGRYDQLQDALTALTHSIDRMSLSKQDFAALKEGIETIERQMSDSSPDRAIVTKCLLSIVRILEQTAGTVLGGLLLSQFNALLRG